MGLRGIFPGTSRGDDLDLFLFCFLFWHDWIRPDKITTLFVALIVEKT